MNDKLSITHATAKIGGAYIMESRRVMSVECTVNGLRLAAAELYRIEFLCHPTSVFVVLKKY